MKTRILLLSTVFFVCLGRQVRAESYENGIGLRLAGITSGIDYKHFFSKYDAAEGILSFGKKRFLLTALYERHFDFGNVDGLMWFVGGGAHIGYYQDGYDYFYYKYHGNKVVVYQNGWDRTTAFGLDFILGLDYKFDNIPIDIGVDVKPAVDIVGEYYGYWDGALSVRFTF